MANYCDGQSRNATVGGGGEGGSLRSKNRPPAGKPGASECMKSLQEDGGPKTGDRKAEFASPVSRFPLPEPICRPFRGFGGRKVAVFAQENAFSGLKNGFSGQKRGFGGLDLRKCGTDLVKSVTDLVKSVADLVKSVVDLVKSETDLVKCVTDLVKSKTDLVECVTNLVKSVADLVKSETDFVKSVMDLGISEGQCRPSPAAWPPLKRQPAISSGGKLQCSANAGGDASLRGTGGEFAGGALQARHVMARFMVWAGCQAKPRLRHKPAFARRTMHFPT